MDITSRALTNFKAFKIRPAAEELPHGVSGSCSFIAVFFDTNRAPAQNCHGAGAPSPVAGRPPEILQLFDPVTSFEAQ